EPNYLEGRIIGQQMDAWRESRAHRVDREGPVGIRGAHRGLQLQRRSGWSIPLGGVMLLQDGPVEIAAFGLSGETPRGAEKEMDAHREVWTMQQRPAVRIHLALDGGKAGWPTRRTGYR